MAGRRWPIPAIGQPKARMAAFGETRRRGAGIVRAPRAGALDVEETMRWQRWMGAPLCALLHGLACASVGLSQIPASGQDGPVTLYYPSAAAPQRLDKGRQMRLQVAPDAAPVAGNGRLVLISHGSGGSPWVHADLASALVEAGFVVALPEHQADNYKDPSRPGPESWSQRPAEVSRAIDAVAADARFAPLLRLDKVGVYGMSAGGHTALTMAGGHWSPAGFKRHCEAHLAEDFQSCVGLITQLRGNFLDGLKKALALLVIGLRFDDERPRSHEDPRVAAVVAGVPAAADFDMASLAHPRAPLALITAGQDRWLIPRFHSERVLAACEACERLAELPQAGHGALLSPLPAGLDGLLGELLNDPPGFDRAEMAEVDRRIVDFFARHLLPR